MPSAVEAVLTTGVLENYSKASLDVISNKT